MAIPVILVVGAGQLGSRYIQGLACIERKLEICVVDTSSASLAVAGQRLAEVSSTATHEVQFCSALDEAPKQIDLALLITPAHCRGDIVAEITNQHQVKAWILEKVLAQSDQQVNQIERDLAGHTQVWVNTPRRLMAWHQEIKSQLLRVGPAALRVRVNGGNWGLACNAIHFIDLVSWWTGTKIKTINSQRLETWHPSKRQGFWEVFGSLEASFMDGSVLELSCRESDSPPHIEVETPEGYWLIDERAGNAIGPSGQNISGRLTFQSALTAPLVEQILRSGCCKLPTLAESADQHRVFLDAMLQHWNLSQARQDRAVPIT